MIEQTPFGNDLCWQQLQEWLRELARRELMSHFHEVIATRKADGSLITETDRAMQQAVAAYVRQQWPEYLFLGEESTVEEQNDALRGRAGCWILDPLDGTTNYAHGFEIFSCSLALQINGRAVLGLVYDPVRDEMFSARAGRGAELNGRPMRITRSITSLKAAVALVDYKRLARPLAQTLAAEPPFGSQRNLGSVALDWCWMAASRAELYLHGGQKLWDYAAGQLIFSEAGGASRTLEGEPIHAVSLENCSAVAASDEALLATWLTYLQAAAQENRN